MNASFTEGTVITLPAQADIVGATFVGATGNPATAAAAGDGTMAIGVAVTSAAAGTHMAVQTSGIARVKCGADATAGQSLAVDANSAAIPASSGAAVGKALADSNAGGLVSALLFPHRL